MRERTIRYDVDSGFIFDENGIQLSGAQLPSLTFRDQLQINLQLIKDGENYTGLAGAGNIGVSAAVDNEYSHYDPAALVGALTAGATISSLRLSGIDITPARAENITLINAANESETIPYEGYAATATAGTFDFTIDSHELAYSYADGAEARLGEPLIIKAATGDATDIATGLVKFVLDGDTSNFQDAVEGSANIPGALCQVYFVDESDDVLFTATFQINLYGRIDDSGAVPPPTDPAYSWSKAAADARFVRADLVEAYPSGALDTAGTFYMQSSTGGSFALSASELSALAAGKINTASNLGTAGTGIFAQKDGVDLQFKSLLAGDNITLTPDADTITIASTGGGGVESFNSETGDITLSASGTASLTQTGGSFNIDVPAVDVGVTTFNAEDGAITLSASGATLTNTGGSFHLAVTGGGGGVESFNSETGAITLTTSGAATLTSTGGSFNINVSGAGGDMLAATYDPTSVAGDAFDSANHAYDNSTSGTAATTVQGALDELAARDHNDLTGLQGGTSGEYYHLSLSDYSAVGLLDSASTLPSTAFAPSSHVGAGGDAHADATTMASGFMSAASLITLGEVEGDLSAHIGAGGTDAHPLANTSGSGFLPALSGNPLEFYNGAGEWAEPMSPITEATTIYVATTGSDTAGDGTSGAPYATINKALDCLAKVWIGADVTISVAGGSYALASNLIVNHPQSRRIRIVGATPITSALSGNIGTVTGGSGAWSITVNVADATGITTGMYALFYNLAGGTNPTTLYGCHEITGVSGNAITIASKAITANSPSGAVTGTFIALPTVVSGTGTLLDIVSGLRALRQICFVNSGTATTNFCVNVRPSEALLNIGYLGIANSYIGMLVDMRAAMVHPLTESPAGQVNAISGCTHGLYVSGGGASGQQIHITGCGTGLTAVTGGSITEASSQILHNTTASSPAINTNGNNNSYITYS